MKRVVAIVAFFMFFNLAVGQTSTDPTHSQGEVAITFDDGPRPETTKKIVDILAQGRSPATFFVVGKNVRCYPSLVAMIAHSGNEIGNHTWGHPQCKHLSLRAFMKEVETTNLEIKKVTGTSPKLFRFPYGESTKIERLIIRFKEGMVPVAWNLNPCDWRSPSPDEITKYVLSRVHSGSIILLHEGKENTVKALPSILAGLEKLGLKPVTLSQLLYRRHLPDER